MKFARKSLWIIVLVMALAPRPSYGVLRKRLAPAPPPAVLLMPPPPPALTREGTPDANANGRADVDDILGCITYLMREGVVYDDQDGGGHIPARRADGKFHMVCVDLLTVCYRTAGYEFGGRNDAYGRGASGGYYRQTARLRQRVMTDPRFHYYPGPGVNPLVRAWRPPAAFRVGDMLFSSYDDTRENHCGIVTSVDTRNGLPSTVTQISSYTPSGSIHRSTYREFFWLKCRTLTGWARPAAWDSTPRCATERAATGLPPRPIDANPVWLPSASAMTIYAQRLQSALDRVRLSRRGVYVAEPAVPVHDSLLLGPRNRHAQHFFQD